MGKLNQKKQAKLAAKNAQAATATGTEAPPPATTSPPTLIKIEEEEVGAAPTDSGINPACEESVAGKRAGGGRRRAPTVIPAKILKNIESLKNKTCRLSEENKRLKAQIQEHRIANSRIRRIPAKAAVAAA